MIRKMVFGSCALVVALSACGKKSKVVESAPAPAAEGLRSVAAFDSSAEGLERSLALFKEIGKVILHPRCVNCHPADERPLQGQGSLHQPMVVRGADGHGAPGLPCASCHGERNYLNVPGGLDWHLAPIEMAWAGKTLGEICEQIKDEKRNGGKSMEDLAEHMAKDALVAYGWNPPQHLEPVPGSQELFGQLFRAWMQNGAHCPAAN